MSAAVSAPDAFVQACVELPWLCASPAGFHAEISDQTVRDWAESVNLLVNLTVSDRADAGADIWRLPTISGGDCEDMVLLKMKKLIERGVDPRLLSVAIALDRNGENHAVLLVTIGTDVLTLDNLTNSTDGSYRFLARQSSDDRTKWEMM